MTYIIHPTADGVAITTPTGEVPIEHVAPDGIYAIVTADQIPSDRTFRAAWVYSPDGIEIDLDRARAIAHNIRRARRADAFAPLDAIISKQLPGTDAGQAESKRQAIRESDARLQAMIEACRSVADLTAVLAGEPR